MKYGQLINDKLEYWNGSYVTVKREVVNPEGETIEADVAIFNPSAGVLAEKEIYPVEIINEVGADHVENGVIKHYVGIERTLEMAKWNKVVEIDAYDRSEAVNEFVYDGQQMWIDVDLRVKIQNGLNKCIELGEETYPVWNGNVCYNIPCSQLNMMLAQLEVYAIKCMDNTNRHKASIMALTDIAEVDAYDITVGYPDKLSF